ncbi:MAG: siderophore ABC transporter substrate-binding protein [Anaerotignaceae bacterium]
MKKLLSIVLIGASIMALAGCSSSKTAQENTTETAATTSATKSENTETTETTSAPEFVTITHSLGTVEIPYDAKNIAVLDLAALDIIDNLGLGDRVTGMPKASYVSYLKSYVDNENIVNLGSLKEVDMEALYALAPDVIFIGGRLSAEYDNLSKIAPVVMTSIDNTIGYVKTFNEYVTNISSIFGMEEKATEILSAFDERIATLNQAAQGKTAIVGLVTSNSLNTVGSTARCSIISKEIGFKNLADDVESTHGDVSSFELVLEKNPDYMFVLDRDTAIGAEGASTAIEVMENEIVMKTDAYQNDKIVYLTPDVWYLAEGGITATDTMLKDLEAKLLSE